MEDGKNGGKKVNKHKWLLSIAGKSACALKFPESCMWENCWVGGSFPALKGIGFRLPSTAGMGNFGHWAGIMKKRAPTCVYRRWEN